VCVCVYVCVYMSEMCVYARTSECVVGFNSYIHDAELYYVTVQVYVY